MNFKTTYYLFAVLFVMLGLFVIVQFRGGRGEDGSDYLFPSLQEPKVEADAIDGVEITFAKGQAEKLVFVKKEDGWRSVKPNTRADSSHMSQIISQVMRASKTTDRKADMSAGLSFYGLDAPAAVVTIRSGERTWSLSIGKASPGKENALVYVVSSDRPTTPAAMPRFQVDSFVKDVTDKGEVEFKGLVDLRARTLAADSGADINRLQLSRAKSEPLVLEKTQENHWKFQKPAYGDADYDGEPGEPGRGLQRITGVRDLMQAVADIRVEKDEDFVANDVEEKDLAEKGLSAGKETLRIEARSQPLFSAKDKKEPVTAVLLVGNKADEKGEKFFARLESENNVVRVDAKKVESLRKIFESPAQLRSRDLAQIEAVKLDAIDVKLSDKEQFKLRKASDSAWRIYEGGKSQEADVSSVQGLINALTVKRQVRDFPDVSKSDAELGLDRPVSVLSIWQDGIQKDEKKDTATGSEAKDGKSSEAKGNPNEEPKLKDEKPAVKLYFGKKDKDVVYVRREVGPEVFRLAVPAGLVDRAVESKLAYLDRRLPSYGPVADVSKVLVAKGNLITELERITKDDKTPAGWKFKQPKELAGRSADLGKVDRLLAGLASLSVDRFVTEKPTAGELDRYGMNAPAVKVTLTLTKPDKKVEDHTYVFGRETDDKTGTYAKQSNRDVLFVLRKGIAEDAQSDFLDATLFRFDVAKVKEVKLVGWQEVVGSPHTLHFERKAADNWVVKAPADYKIDPGKIESFVSTLKEVRVQKFLGPKGAGKPEYKFGLKEGALEVHIILDGEKEPYSLTIGGPSGMDAVHAISNKLASEVFLLPKTNWAEVKGKPAFFQK